MNVMITFNVETDLDIANGSRGEIRAITLSKEEEQFAREDAVVTLTAYVLVKMASEKIPSLAGFEESVIPLRPLERTMTVIDENQKKKK